MAWILIIAGLTAIILLIRYIVSAVVNKGADVIHNAIVEKKNQSQQSEQENLSDRYR